jgi:hypothetical protein
MKNLSHHTDLLCGFKTSLLIMGIQMEQMPKLGWLIGLVMHAIWTDSLCFLHLLLLSISKRTFLWGTHVKWFTLWETSESVTLIFSVLCASLLKLKTPVIFPIRMFLYIYCDSLYDAKVGRNGCILDIPVTNLENRKFNKFSVVLSPRRTICMLIITFCDVLF